ncbi:MAG: NUDIX domain-containing protein [Roseobacter sp.]
MSKRIIKAGLCLMHEGSVLLARSAGDAHFQIPGGKIETGETDVEALVREAAEELDISVNPATAIYLDTFEAAAAGRSDVIVEVRLYTAEISGDPRPSSEIEDLYWQPLDGPFVACSDVVRLHILPYLATRNFGEV